MLTISCLNFNQKTNQKAVVSNTNYITKLHSQPRIDIVSFGAGIPISRESEQLKLLEKFVGTKLRRHPNQKLKESVFISQEAVPIETAIQLAEKLEAKMENEAKKLSNYVKESDLEECINVAYDFNLKSDYRPDPFAAFSIETAELILPKNLDKESLKSFSYSVKAPFIVDIRSWDGHYRKDFVNIKLFSEEMANIFDNKFKKGDSFSVEHFGQTYKVNRIGDCGWSSIAGVNIEKI